MSPLRRATLLAAILLAVTGCGGIVVFEHDGTSGGGGAGGEPGSSAVAPGVGPSVGSG